jgi:hypothetical protein
LVHDSNRRADTLDANPEEPPMQRDEITDLCADIDAWTDRYLATVREDAELIHQAHRLLHLSRELLKELVAEGPQ